MLNTAPDTRSASPLFGFINRPENPQLAISQPGLESPSEFSSQLGALMMAEYKKGNLDLAALSDLRQVNPQSLQAFADSLPFDIDQASDESMFQQLSGWLAQQGLATAFTDPSLNAENSEAGLSLDGLPPGLVENSVLAGAGDSEVIGQTLTQFDELAAELKASVQAMLEALKTDKTSEQKHLAIADFKQALQKMTVLLKEENSSAKFNVNFEDSQSLIAKFENNTGSDASPLLTDFIQNHLLPHAQKLADALSEDQADLAALNSANLSPDDAESDGFSVLNTLEALTALLSSESLSIEDLSDDDLVRLEDIVGFVQALQMQTPVGNDVTHAKPSDAPVEGVVDAGLELVTGEETADLLLNQTSMAIPLSPQATQQAAPQGLAGMAQAAMNRQAPPNNANGVAGQAQTQNPVSELSSKPLQEVQAPVQSFQQQLSQSNLQQQAMNLTLRDQLAQQQQQTLKASDVKYKTADGEGELELLAAQPAGAERKSNAPALASIAYPLRHQQWAQSVGKRIVFMANQQMQQAQISLNPDKLGPIQLRLQLDRDQMVTVSMTAQHGATREALEAAIPRLKEMLEQAGIRFDEVKVEDEEVFEQGNQSQNAASDKVKAEALNTSEDDGKDTPSSRKQTDNMIDFYA